MGSGRGNNSESSISPEKKPSGILKIEERTSFSIKDQVLFAKVSSEMVSFSLTPCVKVSKISTMSFWIFCSSLSKRPERGIEQRSMCKETSAAGTRMSLNSKDPPLRSSVSIVLRRVSVQRAIEIVVTLCRVVPMLTWSRQGWIRMLFSFCNTRMKVSIPSEEKSWITARFHLRSFCWPVQKINKISVFLISPGQSQLDFSQV